VPFGGPNQVRDDRDMKPNPSLVKIVRLILRNLQNQEFPPISDKPHGRMVLKVLGRWTNHRRKLLPKERRLGFRISEL